MSSYFTSVTANTAGILELTNSPLPFFLSFLLSILLSFCLSFFTLFTLFVRRSCAFLSGALNQDSVDTLKSLPFLYGGKFWMETLDNKIRKQTHELYQLNMVWQIHVQKVEKIEAIYCLTSSSIKNIENDWKTIHFSIIIHE